MGLLRGLAPLLTADMLHMLRSAGHGDRIVLVDCNFPAFEVASKTVYGKAITLAGADLIQALKATLSVLPLDYFVDAPAQHMAPTAGPLPPAGQEVIDLAAATIKETAADVDLKPLERFAFYEEARKSFAIVQCIGERRPYANVVLTKGVIGPDGKDLKP